MAADWFPMGYWRSRCPEVVAIAAATGRSTHEVLGVLCDFWSWVSAESVDGHIRGVRLYHLPSAVCADDKFWKAVADANWIAEDEQGIVVPGWENWLSESAKKRARDAIKKRIQRRAASPNRRDATGDHRIHRTEDSKQEETHPLPFPSDAFAATWAEWERHRREIRKPLKPTTVKYQFGQLARLTEPHAIATIRNSITNGWTGLFPESASPAGGPRTRRDQQTDYAAATLIDALGLDDDPTPDPETRACNPTPDPTPALPPAQPPRP